MLNASILFERSALNTALAQAGYRRLKRHLCMAEWGKRVEHYLYSDLYRTATTFLAADFGFSNPISHAFAVKCIDACGPAMHRVMRHRQEPANGSMGFSLGQLAS